MTVDWKLRLSLKSSAFLKPMGKNGFIQKLPLRSALLDVGCGNASPERTKTLRSDLFYTGVDIAPYNQNENSILQADEYFEFSAEDFDEGIKNLGCRFDAVISAHNLEHCLKPNEVLKSMTDVLKPKGKLFLSFPSEQSIYFPSRLGTLNYCDDTTHRDMIRFNDVIKTLKNLGMRIEFSVQQYHPFFLYFIGLIGEPVSRLTNHPVPFGATWAYYGFESIIISQKA